MMRHISYVMRCDTCDQRQGVLETSVRFVSMTSLMRVQEMKGVGDSTVLDQSVQSSERLIL